MGFLMPPHPLKNFEIKEYYQIELRFNGAFSRDNLPKKIKDGAYINMQMLAHLGLLYFVTEVKLFISLMSVVGAPVGIASASFTLIVSLTTLIIKKLLRITRNKKKKHDKILMLAKLKLNSIETLVSQALIDMEISHEEFVTILNEREKYEKMKENVRNVSAKQENMRLNSVNSRERTSL